MKTFRTFVSSLFLSVILLPSKVFADGGYYDDCGGENTSPSSSDGSDGLWFFIGCCAFVALIIFLMKKFPESPGK